MRAVCISALLSINVTALNLAAMAQESQLSQASEVRLENARIDDQQNKLFESTEGWIGGDGFQAVQLQPNRILWLFSDTWLGRVQNGRRVDATIVNNTLSIQNGIGDSATNQFYMRHDNSGKPIAFVVPDDGVGWFWLQAGVKINDKLFLFLTQVDRTTGTGVFSFKIIGQSLGVVENLEDDPLDWKITQSKVAGAHFDEAREIAWGGALLEREDYLYVFGSDEDVHPKSRDRHLVVARVLKESLADFTKWEFFGDQGWQPDSRKCKRIVPNMACDCSVMHLPSLDKYLLTYTEGGLSPRILARTAPKPWGPWSKETLAFECPEMSSDKRLFCYNGKAQPLLSRDGEIVLSYVTNSMELSQIAEDPSLYVPRFVRLTLKQIVK